MAKGQDTQGRVQVTLTKSKLAPKDLGNPREVTSRPDGDMTPHLLGVIFGRATRTKTKTFTQSATGEVVTVDAILGMFEGRRAVALPNDDMSETVAIRSGVLYLPSGIADMIVEPLRADDETVIEFALKISTRKASNPAGYEYVVQELYQPQGVADPLQELRELSVADLSRKALPAPVAA